MEKILVIQTAFIGDAILTLPMIQKLKMMFQDSEIEVISTPSTAEIFSASPFVNNVLILDKRGKHKSIFSLLNFIKEIKKNNYTRIYSPHRSFRTSFIVMSLGVNESYGFSNSSWRHVYKHLIDYIPQHHEVQRNLDLIDFKDDWKILPEIKTSETVKEKINLFIGNNSSDEKLAAIAPGSIWETKKYPSNYFEKVIEFLKDKSFKILLIGGEKDKSYCDSLAAKFDGKIISAAGKFSIVETIELLRRVKILISNDSAPTHFGMCADISVLTLYCSTIPGFGFYPYNKKSSFINLNGLKCKPCGIHGFEKCPINTFACGYELEPQIVISKLEEMLNVYN